MIFKYIFSSDTFNPHLWADLFTRIDTIARQFSEDWSHSIFVASGGITKIEVSVGLNTDRRTDIGYELSKMGGLQVQISRNR